MKESFEKVKKEHREARCAEATAALRRREFTAEWFSNTGDCLEEVLGIIPPGSRVGVGGSVTVRETGLLDMLLERGDEVFYHTSRQSHDEWRKIWKQAMDSPYYISSSNAVTMEGELVNTDQVGNRVAAMAFGPETVIVIAGANKLVSDRAEAVSRIRNVAAPADARKLGYDVPCVEKGYCVDCSRPMRICRVTTTISYRPLLTDLRVFLVAENLGF